VESFGPSYGSFDGAISAVIKNELKNIAYDIQCAAEKLERLQKAKSILKEAA